MIPVQQGQPKGPPAGAASGTTPKGSPAGATVTPKKGPPAGAKVPPVQKPKPAPEGARVPPVQKPKAPPPGAIAPPPRPPAPDQMAAPPMPPPPQNPRGTAGRAPAHPKGKPPPPPTLPTEDVWNNRNVSSDNRDRLTTCVPEWFCVTHGLGADGRHILDWRTSVEQFMDSDLPVLQSTSVEDYLKTLRRQNQRTGEIVAQVALTLKNEMMTEKFLTDISDRAKEIVIQQCWSAEHVRMSPNPLPAHNKQDQVWNQVNAAMDTLHRDQSGGIVLITGGTGTGKSSVLPGYIYLHTIDKASKMDRNTFGMNELRPGGRIMVTQPRKALAKTMASHLKFINKAHQYLFGFHYSGHASSAEHKEPVHYMTEGITVAILMTWVSRVMSLVKKRQTSESSGATKGGTSGSRVGVPPGGASGS
eukprot:3499328-Amphidinium_carterae.1